MMSRNERGLEVGRRTLLSAQPCIGPSGKPAGELVFGGVHLPYTPLSGDPRQPTARRTSPAHLFVGSLGASFALTLAQRLDAVALPWCSLGILSEASLGGVLPFYPVG
jgi:hypothetical protein